MGRVIMSRTETTSKTSRRLASLFSFPNPVNEVSARLVAGGVVVMSACAIAFGQRWLIAVIAYLIYRHIQRVRSGRDGSASQRPADVIAD